MLDRTTAPKAELLEDLSLQDVEKRLLENELLVHCFEDQTNQVIKLDVFFPFGKRNDELAGTAAICTKLMADATLSYASSVLQETMDQYGAHLDISADYDETTFGLLCLKEHAPILVTILKSILTEPLFDEEEFTKIKFQLLQKIRVNNTKNNVIATKTVRAKVLNGSPYAQHASEESIESIALSDVVAFYEKYYTTKPQIVVAGAFDKSLFTKIDALFGSLKFSAAPKDLEFNFEPNYEGVTVKREGSVQASIRLATASIGKNHADYFKLTIANEILGGYFGSRLMKNIREDKGYTYGIYSSIVNYKFVDYHVIGADVQIGHVDDAIQECKKELVLMQTVPVSDNELETVKNYMLGKLASHLDNIFSQADNYKSKVSESIDYKHYFKTYVDEIRKITPDDIIQISQKYFSQEFSVVKVV